MSKESHRETSRRRGARSRRRLPIVEILLLSAFLLLALSFITFRQLRAGEANRLRLLAGFAEQVEATVPVLVETFIKVVETTQEAVLAAGEDDGATQLGCADRWADRGDGAGGGAGGEGDAVASCVEERLGYVPNLSLVSGPCRPGPDEGKTFRLAANGPRVYLLYPTQLPLEGDDDVPTCDRATPLAVRGSTPAPEEAEAGDGEDASPEDEAPEEALRPARTRERSVQVLYRAQLDLETIVQPIVIPDVFDLLVVARREDGAVLFQDGEPELKLAEVDAAWEVRSRGLAEAVRSAWQEASATEPSGGGTRVVETEIAGRSYRIFLQPLTLHLVNDDGNPIGTAEWVTCGIVSWDRLLSSSLTTSPVLLFLMVATFPLLLVSWPFLKMWLISRDQAFTRFDVAAVVVSTLIGLSLASLLVLYFDLSSRVEGAADHQLAELAGRIDAALRQEVAEAAALLADVQDDKALREAFRPLPLTSRDAGASEPGEGDEPAEVRIDCALATARVPATEAPLWRWVCEGLRDHLEPFDLPLLHSVVWVDQHGQQTWKIPFHRDAVLRNSVRTRSYFHCPRGLELEGLPRQGPVARVEWAAAQGAKPNGRARPVCVQSIRSQTTAGDLAVVSLPVRPAPGTDEADGGSGDGRAATPVVMVLTTRLASVAHPLLPPGFSFAVVDDRGDVAFHSDPRRNVVENFLKTADDDQVLAALVRERREGPVQLGYWGSRYRAWARPLEGSPWTLVTLRTTRDLRIRSFELVYDFLIPFFCSTFLAALGVLLGLRFLPKRYLQYLWPSTEYVPLYQRVVLGAAPAAALFGGVLHGLPPLAVLAACVVVPLALVVEAALPKHRDDAGRFLTAHGAAGLGRPVAGAVDRIRKLRAREWLVLGPSVALGLVLCLHRSDATSVYLGLVAFAAAVAYVALLRSFEERTTVAPYLAAATTVFFVAAVLPAFGYFHLAESRQTQLLLQDTQVGLLRETARREERMAAQRSPLASLMAPAPVEADYAGSFFGSSFDRELPESFRAPLWPYGRARSVEEPGDGGGSDDTGGEGTAAGAPAWFPGTEGRVARWLARMLAARPMALNDLSVEPAGTDLSRFEARSVTWGMEDGRLWARLRRAPAHAARPTPGAEETATVSSDLAGALARQDLGALRDLVIALAFVAFTALPLFAAWFLAKKVLLIDLAPNRRYAAVHKILGEVTRRRRRGQRILVQTSLPRAIERMAAGRAFRDHVHVVRFAESWSSGGETLDSRATSLLQPLEVEERTSGPGPGWRPMALLVTDFRPNLDDPAVAEAQIGALEALRTHGTGPRGRSMLVVIDRSYHALTRLAEGTAEDEEEDAGDREREARDRWSAFLSRFSLRYARDEGKSRMFESWIDWKTYWLGTHRWPPRHEPDWYAAEDRRSCPDDPWATVMGNVKPETFADAEERSKQLRNMRRHRKLLRVILEECRWTWRLQKIGIDLVREIEAELPMRLEKGAEGETVDGEAAPSGDWNPPTRHQLRSRIEFAALPYYSRIWDRCEPGEKLVLYQLAHHGVANPKNFDRILDLLNRGLVVRTPEEPVLRLMNRSFGSFIRRTVRRSEAWSWEEEEGVSAWSVWKWVLPIPLLLLAAFLFITQQDAVSNVVGLVIAVTSLVPTAVNLYQYFQTLNLEPHRARPR